MLFVKPQSIQPDDKQRLEEAGVIVVEVDDPSSIKLMRAGAELPGSMLLKLAGIAIGQSESAEKKFGALVAKALASLTEG